MTWANSQTVGDIMLPIRRVTADQTVRTALTILLAEKIVAVAVMQGVQFLGLCTQNEIISAVAARPTLWGDQLVGDVIPKGIPPITVRSTQVLWRAEDLIRQHKLPAIAVVDDQNLVGLLSAEDMRNRFLAFLSDRLSERSRELRNLLERVQDLDDRHIQLETLGTRLQQRLDDFPSPLVESRLDWSALSRPGELCTTAFQDLVRLPQGSIFLIQIDGSNHSLEAVLLDLGLRAQLAELLRMQQSPAEILAHLNRFLFGLAKDHLITAWAGCIDLEKQQLRYATAGHPAPWILPDAQSHWRSLEGRGSFLGQSTEVRFDDLSVPFTPGTRLFLYNRTVLTPTTPYVPHITHTDLLRFLAEQQTQSSATLVTRLSDILSEHRTGTLPNDTLMLMAVAFTSSHQA